MKKKGLPCPFGLAGQRVAGVSEWQTLPVSRKFRLAAFTGMERDLLAIAYLPNQAPAACYDRPTSGPICNIPWRSMYDDRACIPTDALLVTEALPSQTAIGLSALGPIERCLGPSMPFGPLGSRAPPPYHTLFPPHRVHRLHAC